MKRYLLIKKNRYSTDHKLVEFSTEQEMADYIANGEAGEESGYIVAQRMFPRVTFNFVPPDRVETARASAIPEFSGEALTAESLDFPLEPIPVFVGAAADDDGPF